MTSVERTAGDFVIDASLLADAFKLTQNEVRTRMRDGLITSRCEIGVDEDAGASRLTFYHGERACRFIVGEDGTVLKRATFPTKARPQIPFPDAGKAGEHAETPASTQDSSPSP